MGEAIQISWILGGGEGWGAGLDQLKAPISTDMELGPGPTFTEYILLLLTLDKQPHLVLMRQVPLLSTS